MDGGCFLFYAFRNAVLQFLYTMLARAMCAAIEFAIANFHTVPDDLTSTMRALGCQRVNGTFETVEHMRLSAQLHFK